MARPISVIIPGRRARSSRQAPWRNTTPPYRNTAVPNTGAIQRSPGTVGGMYPSTRGSMWPHTRVGTVSASEIQNLSRNIATLWPACSSWAICPD